MVAPKGRRIQKFQRGDRVRIAKDLGPDMAHFTSGVEATVVGSYRDEYPQFSDPDDEEDGTSSYTLRLPKEGEVSWYEEHQLTLIKRAPRCPTCGQVRNKKRRV